MDARSANDAGLEMVTQGLAGTHVTTPQKRKAPSQLQCESPARRKLAAPPPPLPADEELKKRVWAALFHAHVHHEFQLEWQHELRTEAQDVQFVLLHEEFFAIWFATEGPLLRAKEVRHRDRYPPSARRSFNESPSHLLVCGGAPETLLKWGRFPNPEEFMSREVKPEASSTAGATSP